MEGRSDRGKEGRSDGGKVGARHPQSPGICNNITHAVPVRIPLAIRGYHPLWQQGGRGQGETRFNVCQNLKSKI